MSHDRGCSCGREKGEYDDCPAKDCIKKKATSKAQASLDKPTPHVRRRAKSSNLGPSRERLRKAKVDKIEVIPPYHWRLHKEFNCEADVGPEPWYSQASLYNNYLPCKKHGRFRFRGKRYCGIHLGNLLLREKLYSQRVVTIER